MAAAWIVLHRVQLLIRRIRLYFHMLLTFFLIKRNLKSAKKAWLSLAYLQTLISLLCRIVQARWKPHRPVLNRTCPRCQTLLVVLQQLQARPRQRVASTFLRFSWSVIWERYGNVGVCIYLKVLMTSRVMYFTLYSPGQDFNYQALCA